MDATTALLVQGWACAPAAHPAVAATAAVTSGVTPDVGVPVACDTAPCVEFDAVLEQMAGQLQTPEPRHGAEQTVAAGSAKRKGHGARAAFTDLEVDAQPAQDDDGDGDEDADDSGSTALRQMTVMAAGSSVTAPVRESVTVSTERPVDVKVRTAPQAEPKNAYTSARVGRDQPARNGSPRLTSMPTAEPGMAPRVQERTMVLPDMRGTADRDENAQVAPERLTMTAAEGPMAMERERPTEARSTDGQGRVSQQPADRTLASVDARAPQPEGTYSRESVTVSTERPVCDTGRTAPQVEPTNGHTSARVGRDEPARNGSPRSMDMPTAEPGMAPRAQERTVAAMQERDAVWSEGRTMVLPDMRGTAESDGKARVAPERLTVAATQETVATEPEQPAEARSTDGQVRVSQTEGTHSRESVTVSTERPVDGRVRTAAQVEPKNAYTSERVGRDEPARNGSPRSMGMPATEPGMAPRVQERTVAAMQERETVWPEGRTMVLPDMRGTADRDGNAQVAPERLTMAATEEPMATEPEQPTEARSTDGQGRVSRQPADRTLASVDARASQPEGTHTSVDQANGWTVGQGGRAVGGAPADNVPARESVTVSTERPVDGRVRTAPQVEPTNGPTSARVGRDESGWTGMAATEPSMAPRVQEREIAWPEGRTMVLPDMRGTADRDGNAQVAPERLTMAATEELITTEPEQPTEARSTDGQGCVSRQPADRTLASVDARASQPEGTHSRESVTVSTERPVDGRVRTAAQVEPKNGRTSARVGRDQPARSSSPRSAGMSATEPSMAPRVQERTVAAMQERETVWPEGRTMVLPDMRGTADRDGNAQVAPERLTMAATEEPMATEPEQPTEARSTDGQGCVSRQPADRTLASVDARASQPEGTHTSVDQANGWTVGQGGRAVGGAPADNVPVRESVTVSTERPAGDTGHTAPQSEPKNGHTSAKAGRDEPAPNGFPRSAGMPAAESGMAPRVRERTVAAMQERETVWPEGRTMVLPDMRSTADRDGNAQVAPERLTMAATEEPMATESEQPAEPRSTDGLPADRAPVRESVTVSTERPADGRVRTAPQSEPKNAHTSARVGRDGTARNGSPRSMDMTATEPSMAPEIADVSHGNAARAGITEPRQTALRSTVPRGRGTMTALVESLAHRRESEPNARPELAIVVGPTEGPDASRAPQVARPALTEPAGSSVTRQIAAHVSARAAQGGGEFRARLVPEHLGSVQIRVKVVRGVCTADIKADDAEVARYIESHSSDLKVSLAEHGIDLSGLSVSSRSRAQEGWSAAALSHSEPDWSAHNWNGANARQQYAAATFAGGNWRDGRGERRGAPAESGVGVSSSHHAAMQSGSPSSDEPIMARWVRGYARIDYLA